jgi:hypothetical protein
MITLIHQSTLRFSSLIARIDSTNSASVTSDSSISSGSQIVFDSDVQRFRIGLQIYIEQDGRFVVQLFLSSESVS